jgi:Domain of unknown function (DUF4276)
MVRVLAVVEGPTERDFCRTLLAPHLGGRNVHFSACVIGKPGHKGGVPNWERAKKEITDLLRTAPALTTMFDLYALPMSWPGRSEAARRGLQDRNAAEFIEQQIGQAVASEISLRESQFSFIPYLSVYEFEAPLFSDPAILAGVTGGRDHAKKFQDVLDKCGECEKINNNFATKPSARITHIAARYQKKIDGPSVASRIGLQKIREKCPPSMPG